jgi:glycosyltransferase involved in cell wall biosynthesis
LRFRSLRDWLLRDGLFEQRRKWRCRGRLEAGILRRMKHLIGRTAWDRAYAREVHPGSRYHHSDEMLRPEFYAAAWDPDRAGQRTLFASSSAYPFKGFHVLLEALAILKRDYPDVRLRVAGSNFCHRSKRQTWRERIRRTGYAQFLLHRIRALGLEERVEPLGVLDASAMADEFSRARVYVLPSFLENSPNALCEAMMVGTPSVASFVGGIPSLAEDGSESLLVPAGDAVLLAARIRSLFEDDALALTLSENARRRARRRHDPQRIVRQIVSIYRAALQESHVMPGKAAA